MLLVPLVVGWVIAPGWHSRSLALLPAALAFYLMRYPLVLLIKRRKQAGTDRAYLWRWTFIYGAIAALSGGWLMAAYRLWWLAAFALGGGLLLLLHLGLVYRRQEMSVVGELVGIAGLVLGAPMAYYAAAGRLDKTAALLWLLNLLYFGGTVFYIKLKVRQQPRQPRPDNFLSRLRQAPTAPLYQAMTLLSVTGLTAFEQLPLLTPLAFVPAALKSLLGVLRWQDKKTLSLIRLGIIEIVHALLFIGLIIIAFLL